MAATPIRTPIVTKRPIMNLDLSLHHLSPRPPIIPEEKFPDLRIGYAESLSSSGVPAATIPSPTVEHHDPVGHAEDQIDLVADNHHRRPETGIDPPDQCFQLRRVDRIEPAEGSSKKRTRIEDHRPASPPRFLMPPDSSDG